MGVNNIIQILIIILCVYIGLKVTGKFIKFLLFMGLVCLVIYFLLDMGLINV